MADLSEDYLKAKLNFLACRSLSQTDYPPVPSFLHPDDKLCYLFGGEVGRFIRRITHSDMNVPLSLEQLTVGNNFSQLKKGMPCVNDTKLESARQKTICALTQRSQDKMIYSPRQIAEAIRTVDEIFPQGWYKPQAGQMPSIKGHFSSGKKSLGSLGALVSVSKSLEPEQIPLPELRVPRLELFSRIAEIDELDSEFILFPPYFLFPESAHSLQVDGPHVDPHPLLARANELALRPSEQHLVVLPVAVPEPFKVRTVTCGPEGKYYIGKYIQKAVHGYLRQHPNFKLIGTPLTEEILEHEIHHLGPGQFYVSGDYSAATDHANPHLSEAIARRISLRAGFSKRITELFVDMLVNHRLWTGDKKLPRGVELTESQILDNSEEQIWGQLMGSNVSFFVLCILNASLTRTAMELRYQRTIKLRDSGILINGDDIGFVADDLLLEIWKRETTEGGLSPSPGKNFTSKDFLILNSTMHRPVMIPPNLDSPLPTVKWVLVPYINYGLLQGMTGQGRSRNAPESEIICASTDPKTPDLGTMASDLIWGHPEDVQVILLKRFIKQWEPELRKFCPPGLSYYLPKFLGGMGFPIIGTFHALTDQHGKKKERFSRCQRVLAGYLSHDPERQAKLCSMASIGSSDSFSMWQRIAKPMKRILDSLNPIYTKSALVSDTDDKNESELGKLTTPLLIQQMLLLRTSDLTTVSEEEDRYQAWRKEFLELFDHARRTTFLPMSDEEIIRDLPFRRRFEQEITVTVPGPQIDLKHTGEPVSDEDWMDWPVGEDNTSW